MLRPATTADLPAIRDVQIASWRDAYRGHLPDDFLGQPVADILSDRWSAWPGPDWFVETAWDGDTLTGFVSVDRAHDGGPYVDNLHVTPGLKGRGTGRALMAGAAARLAGEGAETLWLTVMRDNTDARAFYARIGGVEGDEMSELLYGQPVTTYPVRWHDLPMLAALAPG